jgi:hypothetical protein
MALPLAIARFRPSGVGCRSARDALAALALALVIAIVIVGCGGGHPATATPPGAVVTTSSPTRVLVLNWDGFHSGDGTRFIADHPDSALASLAAAGVRYTNVTTSKPSDSFPGVLAMFTGGSPATTGVYYDLSYDRTLSPPGSDCSVRGTTVNYSEQADVSPNSLDGGGGLDPQKLPRDPQNGCQPVMPHAYPRVNNVFEIVRSDLGGRTAWSDKHLSYELLQGPSGTGVDDLFVPEIAANKAEKSLSAIEAYDDRKVEALLNQIHGKDHAGAAASVPALFGMNFQAISVEQKSAGYLDGAGTPTAPLAEAMQHTDASLGRIVAALKDVGLWSTTVVMIATPQGQSPIDPSLVRAVDPATVPNLVNGVQPGLLAQFTGDDVGLVWLTDQSRTADVKATLDANRAAAGIATVLAGADLGTIFPDPTADARTPDLVLITQPGTIYTASPKLAEHGGFADDDTQVGLLVVNAGGAAIVSDPVETRQIAPTILWLLRLDPRRLRAVTAEGTTPLPGLTPN